MIEEKSLFRKYIDWRKAKKEKERKKREEQQTFAEVAFSWVKTILGAIVVVMIINGLAIASFVVPTGSMENTVMTGDFLFVNKFIYGPSTPQVIPFLNVPIPFYSFPSYRDPERGDVIVFIFPGSREELVPAEFQYYLKRCVAIAGDTLQIKNKQIFVNGKLMEFPEHGKILRPINNDDRWRTFPVGKNFSGDNYGPLRIPKEGDVININKNNYRQWAIFIKREQHKVELRGSNVYIDDIKTDSYIVERDYCFGMGDNRDNSEDSRYWGFIPKENIVGTPIVVFWSWDTGLPITKIIDKFISVQWTRIGTLIH